MVRILEPTLPHLSVYLPTTHTTHNQEQYHNSMAVAIPLVAGGIEALLVALGIVGGVSAAVLIANSNLPAKVPTTRQPSQWPCSP